MEEYMYLLIKQYKKARGLLGIDINSMDFKIDFDKWLKQYQENCVNYASLLYSLGIDFINKNTAEVNKGFLDSVVLPYETTIISPYIFDNSRENIYNNSFFIQNGMPFYKYFKNDIYRYMTHNPYKFDNSELINIRKMHEYTNYEIVLGMFGNLYDEDRKNKLKKLENLKKTLCKDYIEEYDILNDGYYYLIASKPKKKIKEQ